MAEGSQVEERQLNLSNIDQSLNQILNSSGFKGSAQLQTLLKYIVEGSIHGRGESLKERIIGIDVFGRKSDYDTADDPIVRSRVGLLRKRLAHYYESEESRGSAVQIVIPNGSYRPTFVFRPEAGVGIVEPQHEEQPLKTASQLEQKLETGAVQAALTLPARSVRRIPWRISAIAVAALCVVGLAVWAFAARWYKSELYLVWEPLLESKKTVLLYTGTISPVYLLGGGSQTVPQNQADQELPILPPQSLTEGETPAAQNLAPFRDGLVPPGDISADMRISVLMNTYNRGLSLRYGTGLPFLDLKGSPTVLIGAYDNYWTMELAHDLPFFFDRGGRIRERGGQHRVWSSVARADNAIREDFAVVFRLLDSKAGGPVIAIAGLTTCGTQAAAEFITDPTQLKKLGGIPRGSLEHKNLEFVLHASLENCTPTSVDIVGQQVW
jgi:hypothetical protein